MHRKQQTVIVHRLMGKVGERTSIVPTLLSTDRIISANDDESGEFTWLRYETERAASGNRAAYQNWKIMESIGELLLLTNALVPYEQPAAPEPEQVTE